MIEAIWWLNATAFALMALMALWVALDARFPTRALMTIGLAGVVIGAGVLCGWSVAHATSAAEEPYWDDRLARAILVLNGGVMVTLTGALWRLFAPKQRRHPKRRSSDFTPLDEADHMRVVGRGKP